jgi:TRAP-type mannitol/chloroaromatic compound transport system substrate-binding protein
LLQSTDEANVLMLSRYDHEEDGDFEQMQKAESYILSRYPQFLPPAFAAAQTAADEGSSDEDS